MKRLINLAVIAAFTMTVLAQAPQKMSYQFVVRNTSGTLLANHAVGIKISILQGSATSTVIYAETYSPNPQTDANGLVSLEIGSGTAVTGTFTGINWAQGPYFLKTETDPQGGTSYTISGTSQLLSVPYALYAKTAANGFSGDWADITGKPVFATVATSGIYNDLLNRPVLFSGAWADITGKPTTLAGYGITDADGSITNEIQALTLSGTVLSLSNGGGSVTLPSSGGGDNWGTQVAVTDATLEGNGTVATPLRIADNGVNSLKIQDGTIVTADIADQTITTVKLGNLAVTADKIQNGAVTTDKLANGAVTGSKIAQGGAASGHVLKWDGTSWIPAEDNEGGLTLPYSGTGTSGGPLFNIVNLGTSGAVSTLSAGNYGIWGESTSSTGIGVYGVNKTSSGETYGVVGDVYSPAGFSGFFQNGKFYVEKNAGFGTQNPEGMVEVNGNSVDNYPNILLSEADGYARLSYRTMIAPSKHWVLAGHTNSSDESSQFHLNYNNGSTGKNIFSVYGDSRIALNGEVGIGTINPGSLLQVHSDVTYASGITPIISISDNFKIWNIGLGSSGDRFSIASEDYTERLTILKSNGNVGIGLIPSNLYKLDVSGNLNIISGRYGDALWCNGSQALWYDGTYFSWGYGATYNYFARKVTIGNPANPGYMLYVQGSAYATGTWSSSDARFKKNIATIDNPLEKLMKVRGARFEFRTDEFKDYQFAEGPQLGFIAQELENVFPEMVKTESNGYKSLNYSEMIPVLVEALKEQQKQIEELKKEIALLK